MANRILRDWTTSEVMDSISMEAEVFFTRLIMKADDYGSFYSNPKLLKAALFPLKDITYQQIGTWMFECIDADLILLYEVDGKEYLRIKNFKQRLRQMRNVFPHPVDGAKESTATRQRVVSELSASGPHETETKQKQETETKEPADAAVDDKKDSRETIPFQEGSAVLKAWSEWVEYRKEKKKKLTPSTIKKQIQFLGGRGDPEIIEIINQSIRNGWEGLFDLKHFNNKSNGRATIKRSSDAVIEGGRPFGTFD